MMIADTDVLIDFLAGAEPWAKRIRLELQGGRLHTTSLTAFELLAAARGKKQRAAVEKLLDALTVLPVDRAVGEQAARLQREHDSTTTRMCMQDAMVAATCLHHRGVLLVRDARRFDRVAGLILSVASRGD